MSKEIKVPIERITEIENRLEKMTGMFEETMRQMTPLVREKGRGALDARKVLGIDVIENRLEQMTEKLEETLLQVKTKGIRPTHAEALKGEYAECDLQDMIILLEEAEKEDKDSFYNHWDTLLKTSSTGELIDALFEVLQTEGKHTVSRFDEIFDALKGRAPFEQMYHHIEDMKKDITSNEQLIRGGLQAVDLEADSKYVFLEKKLDRLVKFIKSKYQADAEVLDELMTK